jgi:hypothetical protein
LHRLLERALGGVPGRRHQRVLIVERDQIEHQIADRRLCGADHALHAAGALLQLQPDHGRSPDLLERLRDARGEGAAQAEDGRELGAEGEKIAPAHTTLLEVLRQRLAFDPGMGRRKEHGQLRS